MSHCVNSVKDANPKIASVALTSLSVLIRKYREDFHPLANMSFEQLLIKMGDAKVMLCKFQMYFAFAEHASTFQAAVRDQALDVVVPLVEILGVASTFERIVVQQHLRYGHLMCGS
jgi:hypothetical protein